MEYYKRKTTAIRVIEKTALEGDLGNEDIAYLIEKTYGFNPKFTLRIIKNLRERGFLEKNQEKTEKNQEKIEDDGENY